MNKIHILFRLNQLLDQRWIDEKNIEAEADASGLDLGPNLKSRLNYLVSLGILRQPEPKYYGKGKGGTRLFQRDVMPVLNYVDEQRNDFSFNEISGIIRERREDLTRQIYKDLNIEKYIQNPSVFIKTLISYADSKLLFTENLLRTNVMSKTIGNIGKYITELKAEIVSLNSFRKNVGKNFCKEDRKKLAKYIEQKSAQKEDLKKIMEKMTNTAEDLVEKIQSEEY